MAEFDKHFWGNYFQVYDILTLLPPYQSLMKSARDALALAQEDTLLDVGSGTGNFLLFVKGLCAESVGIDNSEEGIAIHKTKDPGAKTMLHDIRKTFPFPKSYFTKAVSINTLYTLEEPDQQSALKEVYRVLKPNGCFVMANPKPLYSPLRIYKDGAFQLWKTKGAWHALRQIFSTSIPAVKMFYYNMQIKKQASYHFASSEEYASMLREAGFEEVSAPQVVYAGEGILFKAVKKGSDE